MRKKGYRERFLRDAEKESRIHRLEWEIYKNLEKMGNGWLFSFHRIPLESDPSHFDQSFPNGFSFFPEISHPSPRVFQHMNNS